MKTTLELPDDLMRTIKVRAAQRDRKLKDEIADLLRRGLALEAVPAPVVQHRVALPLIECVHAARPTEEVTPERVAAILLDDEAEDADGAVR